MDKKSIVEYSYGFVMYEDSRSGVSCFRKYGWILMIVTKTTALKLPNWLQETVRAKSMVQHYVPEAPAPFCAIHNLNNLRSFPAGESLENEKLSK